MPSNWKKHVNNEDVKWEETMEVAVEETSKVCLHNVEVETNNEAILVVGMTNGDIIEPIVEVTVVADPEVVAAMDAGIVVAVVDAKVEAETENGGIDEFETAREFVLKDIVETGSTNSNQIT